MLARADNATDRQATFRHALTVIAEVPSRSRRHNLTRTAATLAGIHLTPDIILKLAQEAAMPITLDEDTVAGRAIAATAEARGEAHGRAATLAGLLRRTFGDDPRIDTIAHHLATLPQDQALETALNATNLDDLTPA